MKKTICCLTAIAALAFALASCQKEETAAGPLFNGSRDVMSHPEGKTVFHPENNTFTWKTTDRIHIWDASRHHKLYNPTTAGRTASAIAPKGIYNTLDETSHYRAIYPDYYADTTVSNPTNVQITLPVTQCMTNQEDDVNTIHLTRFPIYCETDNHTLYFKNLCGAIRLRLQLANTSVERIAFSSTSDPVCGQFSINWNSGDPTLTPAAAVSSATNTVVLEYAQPINISSATDFWISLPPAEYDNFQIKVSCLNSDGTRCTRSFKNGSEHSLTIPRGVFIPITPDLSQAPAVASGLFSVASNRQVYFSPGNLQNVNNHWEFSPKQYEISYDLTVNNGQTHVNYDPEHSFKWYLFGWSTANSNFGREKAASSYPNQVYKNFGEVFSGQGVNSPWRVLTADEFGYLLGHPTTNTTRISDGKMHITVLSCTSTTTYTDFGSRVIDVEGQHGLLIFPDVCTIALPEGVSFPNANTPNGQQSSTGNYYTKEQFVSIFEKAGCAFLPYSGFKTGADNQDGTSYRHAPTGYYWTSSYSIFDWGTNKCQAIYFTGNGRYIENNINRNSLYCVRLVTDYHPSSNTAE